MRESDIERHLVQRVKDNGGEIRKVKWIGRRAAPDRYVMLPQVVDTRGRVACPPRCIWIEVKRPGKLRTFPADGHERAQYREHERLRGYGQRVEVIDSIEGVEALFSWHPYLNG